MQLGAARYFLALMDELNFSLAAKRCRISQPSLTSAIKRLERQIDGELSYRRPTVAPTRLALALRPHFEDLASAADALLAKAQRAASHSRRRTQQKRAPTSLRSRCVSS
jgi:DNA-binding transcriptional LysR family regulator